MPTHERSLRILQILLQQVDFVPASQIAASLGVSARTVRDDIKDLSAYLNQHDIVIRSTPSKGYCIAPADRVKMQDHLRSLQQGVRSTPNLPIQRRKYILKKLFFSPTPIPAALIMEDLCISRSTLEKDIQEISTWLEQNGLHLRKNTRSNYYIEGSEIAMRYGILDYFYSFTDLSSSQNLEEVEQTLQVTHSSKIIQYLKALHGTEPIHLSDTAFMSILLYLLVGMHRLSCDHHVHIDPREIPTLSSQKEFAIAIDILKNIEHSIGFLFPESEVMQFTRVLMQANIIAIDQKDIRAIVDDALIEFVNQTLFEIEQHFGHDLKTDRKLINSLVLYIRAKLHDSINHTQPSSIPVADITQEYPQALEITMLISTAILRQFQIHLSEPEISELALLLCAAFERHNIQQVEQKMRVAVICASGIGGSQLLSAKIARSFRDLEILGIYPSYRLHEVHELHPDLILSTVPLEDMGIPSICVSPLLSDIDMENIHAALNEVQESFLNSGRQLLISLLKPELFFPQLALDSIEEVIHFLSSKMIEADFVDADFPAAVLAREAIYPTAIGNLVAIPHAFLIHTIRPCIAIASLRKPIHWGSEKAQLILLLNISTSQEESLKPIFDQLFQILKDRKQVKRLIKAENFTDLIKEMNE